jgi:hypothetical protein
MFTVAAVAFGAKPVTVQQLTQTLISLHQAGNSDDEVAASLQHLQLSEEITAGDAAELQQYLPGPASRDQLAVLRGLSAFAPSQAPASAPATPDAAAQSAMLARAEAWIASTFKQTPSFTATRAQFHYQEDAQGTNSAANPLADPIESYRRSSDENTDVVQIAQGAEQEINPPSKVNWGENGQISDGGAIPSLPNILERASASGKMAFTRWETVNGKPAAVFSFSVEKKKMRYTVDYCCFPMGETVVADQTPSGEIMVAPVASVYTTRWHPFRKDVPYHGYLYIDPDSGAILRIVTKAELKPFDFVRVEETRIDYATEAIGGKAWVVPVRRVRLTETIPGGDTRPTFYPIRRTLLTVEYVNNQTATK